MRRRVWSAASARFPSRYARFGGAAPLTAAFNRFTIHPVPSIEGEDPTMGTSEKVLVVGGSLSLLYGFLLGLPLTAVRMKAPTASRHLVTGHLAAIIQGAAMLAVAGVMDVSDLPSRL